MHTETALEKAAKVKAQLEEAERVLFFAMLYQDTPEDTNASIRRRDEFFLSLTKYREKYHVNAQATQQQGIWYVFWLSGNNDVNSMPYYGARKEVHTPGERRMDRVLFARDKREANTIYLEYVELEKEKYHAG